MEPHTEHFLSLDFLREIERSKRKQYVFIEVITGKAFCTFGKYVQIHVLSWIASKKV